MMMTENFKAHSMMQAFLDKGLQSQSIADVLTTVTECARCIREYPFPAFVSSTLHRLAQAFQGEIFGRRFEQSLNIIRLRIVTAVKECNDSLALNFSSDAIVRLIMKVSHSNDFKARSLTLLLLGSLAPLIFEDKKVHNLIIESLDCMETAELAAAINAAIDMSKHSHSFSALIVPKIAEMMDRSQLSNSMKMELFGIVSNLRDFSVTRNCIELGKALLLTSPDPKMHTVVYCSLTQLVARNETMIYDQISLLISELDKVASQDNKELAHSILLNLTILANNQSRWNRAQIEAIRDFYPKLSASKGILCNWLHCLEVLSSANVHNYIFIESHPWSQLLSSDDIVTRIFAIKLAHNLLQTGQTSIDFREAFLLSISSTLCHFIDSRRVPQSRILGQLRHEFLVIVSAFVRSTQCSPEFAFSLGKSILRAELRESSKELFELLAVITDSNWAQCQEIVFSTLFAALDAVQNLVQVPAIVFTLLLATSPATLFETNESARRLADFAGRLLSQPQIEHWNLYLVARSALRYGHWKSVALPLLERVRGSCENMETESWLSGLVHICTAQPTAFTVDQLADCESHLQLAALNFTLLNSTEKNQPFGFATDYVTCLGSTGTAIRQLLVIMNVKLCSFRSTAAVKKATQLQRKSIVQSLNAVKNSIVDAKQRWVTLCSKSFDADTQTLLQMALMTRMCLLLEQFVGFLCSDPQKKEQQKLSEIPLEDLGECTQQANFKPSAQTQNFHALLIWARGELLLAQQQQAAEPNILANLELFQAILRHLVDFPLGLPRFFFQRVQRTRIKLIITPQPQDDRPVFRVSSTELLPVIIEGIIESDNPKSIESVCVVLTLKRDNAAATEKKQMIQLEPAQKYFRAQFLLKISHQRTKVSAKVWFVDTVTKKQWFDESDSATLIVELMDGAGAQQTLTG